MTMDVETRLREAAARLLAEAAATTPPPVGRVRSRARTRRRRNTAAVAVAIASVLAVGAGAVAAFRSGDPSHVATGVADAERPDFRVLPLDTIGTTLSFAAFGPDPDSDAVHDVAPELRGVHLQRWERDGATVLAVQSSGIGGFAIDGATTEMVDVPGWGPSTLLDRPGGTRSLMLWDGRQQHELLTRELPRAQLVELAGQLRSRAAGLGAEVPREALPDAYEKVLDTYEPPRKWVFLQYGGGVGSGVSMSVQLRSSSPAQHEIDRFREPAPRTATVLGRSADVWQLHDRATARVRLLEAPGVQAVVEVHAARDENVELALRVAGTLREVDAQTWADALSTTLPTNDETDGTTAATTRAPDR